jgi:fatty-acyl-CoA synthase
VFRFEDWQQHIDQTGNMALPHVSPSQSAMIQYTSGTTGNPKGAVLTHFGVVNNALLTAQRLCLSPHSVWLLSLPMFHTSGSVYSLLGTICNRGTLILMPQFEARLLIQLVEEEKVNYFQSVPTIHQRVIEHEEFSTERMASLKGIGGGGASVPEELVHRLERAYGAEFFMMFGQTETSAVVTHTGPADTIAHKSQTIGLPLPRIEVKVINPSTHEIVPRGDVGEICIRGFGVMKEYFDMPEQTAEAIDAERWLHSGDLGAMQPDGYLTIRGRLKEMIIRAGENIFPREIEDVLAKHPAVLDAAVLGIPDRDLGEQVAAAVRFKEGCSATSAELEEFVREHIARHKVPKKWAFVNEYPLTPSGKIRKYALREMLVEHSQLSSHETEGR